MNLSDLRPAKGSKQGDKFRKGRGHGSGNGKTAGYGHKGQKARSGAPRTGFEDGAEVTAETLVALGVISNPKDGVKILGNGELTKKLNVKVSAYSASAMEKIKALGGNAEVI